VDGIAGVGPFGGVSIAELGARVRGGGSARELVTAALDAAAEWGALLNCFVTVDADGALRAAEQADRELAAGVDRGPLHGIPVGVKDLIDTAGLRTTYGSEHFAGHVPVRDAAAVAALRQAGAVVVGKTHTHEFAYGPTGDVSATGPARNPHDPDRITGGSSSGSAAAVAAGLLPAALGTDTGGSVRIPAALCGLTGLRPSAGTVSTAGVFPLSRTLDSVGPMAATPADTALLFAALTGRPGTGRPVEGLRVGVLRPERLADRAAAALAHAVAALAGAGCAVRPVEPDLREVSRVYPHIQSPEARAVHAERIAAAPELFQPEVLSRLEEAAQVRGWEHAAALADRERLRPGFLDGLGVDALVLPTVPIEAPPIGARDTDVGAGWTNPGAALLSLTSPWSVLGLPALSTPVPGPGLPRAVQLVGQPGAEALLFELAARL
jgi:aspartyl-tRNA(Asn)/glutamyl-tRNA(Gln) amidotransferase subunit A